MFKARTSQPAVFESDSFRRMITQAFLYRLAFLFRSESQQSIRLLTYLLQASAIIMIYATTDIKSTNTRVSSFFSFIIDARSFTSCYI